MTDRDDIVLRSSSMVALASMLDAATRLTEWTSNPSYKWLGVHPGICSCVINFVHLQYMCEVSPVPFQGGPLLRRGNTSDWGLATFTRVVSFSRVLAIISRIHVVSEENCCYPGVAIFISCRGCHHRSRPNSRSSSRNISSCPKEQATRTPHGA